MGWIENQAKGVKEIVFSNAILAHDNDITSKLHVQLRKIPKIEMRMRRCIEARFLIKLDEDPRTLSKSVLP
jgi:hypothetical protein